MDFQTLMLWQDIMYNDATKMICVFYYTSLLHSFIVLSFSSAAEAMMFSVGWQAQQRTTSERAQRLVLK